MMDYQYQDPPTDQMSPLTKQVLADLLRQIAERKTGGGGMNMPSMPSGLMNKIPGLGGVTQVGAGAGGADGFGYTGALGDTAIDGTYLGGSTSVPESGGFFSNLFGGGASGGSGASGAMSSAGPIAAIMAAVAATKEMERAQGNSTTGKIWGTFNAPSINQIKADHKLGWTTLFGVPFVNGFIRNDKAAEAKPEWSFLLGK